MKPTNKKALKEWAVIVKALGEGRQTILIRKQNLRFTHNEFFLYPTYTGQTRDRFKDQYHAYFDASMAAKREGELTIRYYAQIDEAFEVTSSKVLMDLDTHYVWTSSHVKSYFDDSKDNKLYVLVLRVFKLPKPEVVELHWLDTWYKGMSPWVNLPEAISHEGCSTVLNDNEFTRKAEKITQIVVGPGLPKTRTERLPGHKKEDSEMATQKWGYLLRFVPGIVLCLIAAILMFFGTWPLQIRIIIGIIGIALIATSAVPWRAKKP